MFKNICEICGCNLPVDNEVNLCEKCEALVEELRNEMSYFDNFNDDYGEEYDGKEYDDEF